jgi:hypothetical protein
MKKKYVWRDGRLVDCETGVPEPPLEANELTIGRPYVMSDLPDYVSPVTGEVVSGRRERRYDLESNHCREVDPSEWHGKYLNPKYGPTLEE